MAEKIFNIIDKIFEKHLMTALIAVLPTAIIYYCTNDKFSVLVKFGTFFYIVVLLVANFLAIETIKYIVKLIIRKNMQKKEYKTLKAAQDKENIMQVREFIDGLQPNERELVNIFLENGNTPLISLDANSSTFVFNYCYYTKVITEKNTEGILLYNLRKEKYESGYQAYKFKLREDIYNYLKKMRQKNINISNF